MFFIITAVVHGSSHFIHSQKYFVGLIYKLATQSLFFYIFITSDYDNSVAYLEKFWVFKVFQHVLI